MQDVTTIRLNKFLANAGLLSRRNIEQLLKDEIVTVNGKRVLKKGIRINPLRDIVLLNGNNIRKPHLVYFLLNKPKGVVSTTNDEMQRKNVVSLIQTQERIYPIGRLDKETHGLLLLTNDGNLTNKLIHPRYHVPKVYRLIIQGKLHPEKEKLLEAGVMLSDGITLPAEIKVVSHNHNQTVLLLTLFEGRNRQIRRMCESIRIQLLDLQRISFGPIQLGDTQLGTYRKLTETEIKKLYQAGEIPEGKQVNISSNS